VREVHAIRFKDGLGTISNNYVELTTLKLILILAMEKDVQKI
jgi:hypothetical protein